MCRARASTRTSDGGDARFAMDQFARSIAHADAKAGLLAAALLILAGALGQQGRSLLQRLPPQAPGGWVSLAALVAATIAVVAAIAFLLRAVTPSVESSGGFSRYSWVSMADASVADLLRDGPGPDPEQGWRTAVLLASIARRKFHDLRRAFRWSTAAALAFLVVVLANLVR